VSTSRTTRYSWGGNFALARGNYVVTLIPKSGGDAIVVRRRFPEIWRGDCDLWRAFRAMDNSGAE
jgi:hypothetical protein